MSTSIQPVRHGDFAAIAALTNHYIDHTTIHFGYEHVTPDELRLSWEKGKDRYPYLVALDEDGGLLGYAKCGVWRDRAAYQWSAETGIYVAPSHHGQGIGKSLYRKLIERCARCGFHTLIGGITLPNEASVRLHESMGFVKVAHVRDAGWKFDAWHDVGFWQRHLRERTTPAGTPPALRD